VAAILAGSAALFLRRRAAKHRWAGRLFLITMGLAIALAIPVIVARKNLFLTGVGLLVIYHAFMAWRLARLRPPLRMPSRGDRLLQIAAGVVFVVFALYGVLLLASGLGMGIVPIVLALISLTSVRHFARFMNRVSFEPGAWVQEHLRAVATAFIASITAFTTATAPRLLPGTPQTLWWLGPTVLLTPLFIWFGREVKARRGN
jgi:hypothetical protein